MRPAQPVEGAERPALEIGEHAVGPCQHDMGGPLADDLRIVVVVRQAGIAAPAVGDQARARRGDAGDKGVETAGGEVLDRRQPDAAGFAVWRQFDRTGDEHLAHRAASLTAGGRIVLGAKRDGGLVGLDQVFEQARSGDTMAQRSLCNRNQAVL